MSQNDRNDDDEGDLRVSYTLLGTVCVIVVGMVLSWQFGLDAIGKLVAIAGFVAAIVAMVIHYGSRIGRL